MFAKQLTVFMENREGRLSEALKTLGENNVNILSLSLADTTEFGLLRLIVDNPTAGKQALSQNGFSCHASDVCIIKVPHKAGSLNSLLSLVEKQGVNVEYMYAVSVLGNEAYIVIKASDMQKLEEILKQINYETVDVATLTAI